MLEERDVLILGGGFAGAYVGRLLRERVPTIVSHENFMLYTPLLPEAASGTLEPRHTVVPLRVMCPRAELILGSVEGIDLEARTARVDGRTLHWRDLVVALGAVPRAVPDHALTFKSLEDAIQLRNHVLGRLEAADASPEDAERELTFVFVGAGYAGVEALAELSDLVDDALQYYPHLRAVPRRWVLVDAATKILPEIPPPLGEYAAEELTRRGVEIHVGTTLERTSEDEVALADGTVIATRTLVWTAGIVPNPLLSGLGLPLDERGRIEVDEHLGVRGHNHVWSLGDCARVPNRKASDPDPPTCQHALRQARRLAKNIEGDVRPYGYRMLGQVATLGRYKGIADVLGVRFRGFPGWFVTRSYHLYQLPLASRRLRVVAGWTTSLLFRRDVVKL